VTAFPDARARTPGFRQNQLELMIAARLEQESNTADGSSTVRDTATSRSAMHTSPVATKPRIQALWDAKAGQMRDKDARAQIDGNAMRSTESAR
jgi:hypothetical protein